MTTLATKRIRPAELKRPKRTRLGALERAVMDYLWSANRPTTVREVHELLSADRVLAYTTVMTVMNRLARKNLLVQQRDTRAHRFVPVRGRAELVAEMMVDALHEASEADGRRIALVHFVGKVSADEAAALRRSLAAIEAAEEAS